MQLPTYKSALIVGAGEGLSASLTRLLRGEGLAVAIAARDSAKLGRLCAETGAQGFSCDAQDEAQVRRLFAENEGASGPADVVIYNASSRTRGPFVELGTSRRPARIAGHGVRRVSRGAAGSGQDGAARTRSHPVYGRIGEREGIRSFGTVRDGQVRVTRTGPEPRP